MKDILLVFILKAPEDGNGYLYVKQKPLYSHPHYFDAIGGTRLPIDAAFLVATKPLGEVYVPRGTLRLTIEAEQYEDEKGQRHDFECNGEPVTVRFFEPEKFVRLDHRHQILEGLRPDPVVLAFENKDGFKLVLPDPVESVAV